MTSLKTNRPAAWACLAAALVTASGCSQAVPEYCPVRGQVLVNDVPAGGVCLQFHGERPDVAPDAGRTDEEGNFTVLVHGPGKYVVTAFWPTVELVEGEEIEGEDRFSGRYRLPGQSGMRITVQQGQNELPPIRFE